MSAMTGRTSGGIELGVSLKMYLGVADTVTWAERVAALAASSEAVRSGRVRLFAAPSPPALPAVIAVLRGTRVRVSAQNLHFEDRGAFTGEVSGADLAELGCSLVEIGHAERRALFGETDAIVARKVVAAMRNGLSPVLCIGEDRRLAPEVAAAECVAQLSAALAGLGGRLVSGSGAAVRAILPEIIVAYEPVWAIGRAEPASPEHVATVAAALAGHLEARPEIGASRVIYGGSAQPGTLTALGDGIGGLFLGRFAHDTADLGRMIEEADAESTRRG